MRVSFLGGILLAMAGAVSLWAQEERPQRPEGGPPMRKNPIMEIKAEDGSISVAQLLELIQKELKSADKNNDGVLSEEEQRDLTLIRTNDRGPGGFGGPMGGPGMRGPLSEAMNDKEEIELAKLPENMPEKMREELTSADKNKDGVLSKKEQKKVPFLNRMENGRRGQREEK